jgi:hypothetical protein
MLPFELWEPNCKASSLPVDEKYYQKGQSMDNYIIL